MPLLDLIPRIGSRAWPLLLDSLYAPTCAACDKPLLKGQAGMCTTCLESCETISVACALCAAPIGGGAKSTGELTCAPCQQRGRSSLASVTASFEYGGQLAIALRRLKFQGRSDVARTLCPLLLPAARVAAAKAEVALALPLHQKRLSSRGFNQAQRLLLPLAKELRIPTLRSALWRVRNTASQAKLRGAERRANVHGAFRAKPLVKGKRILLVDDIRTTGSTLRAAADALRLAGASEIHAFVVATADFRG